MYIKITDAMCAITKRVVADFNSMDDFSFLQKYKCTKPKYFKRVKKYGDPYTKAPLAIIGKILKKLL